MGNLIFKKNKLFGIGRDFPSNSSVTTLVSNLSGPAKVFRIPFRVMKLNRMENAREQHIVEQHSKMIGKIIYWKAF